jgi:hypothetical protein
MQLLKEYKITQIWILDKLVLLEERCIIYEIILFY